MAKEPKNTTPDAEAAAKAQAEADAAQAAAKAQAEADAAEAAAKAQAEADAAEAAAKAQAEADSSGRTAEYEVITQVMTDPGKPPVRSGVITLKRNEGDDLEALGAVRRIDT